MAVLDGEKWERHLVAVLNDRKDEILGHMETTELLTNERKGQRVTYFSLNEGISSSYLFEYFIVTSRLTFLIFKYYDYLSVSLFQCCTFVNVFTAAIDKSKAERNLPTKGEGEGPAAPANGQTSSTVSTDQTSTNQVTVNDQSLANQTTDASLVQKERDVQQQAVSESANQPQSKF